MKTLLLFTSLLVGSALTLGGRGSKSFLSLIAGRSSDLHPLHATEPIIIWCAPDNPQVVIKTAQFTRVSNNEKLEATLNPTRKNATYTFASPSIKDAGEYKCDLDTPHGRISHMAFIYSRPVLHSNEHFTEHEGRNFHLENSGNTFEKGQSITLTCPAIGFPKPVVKWTKDGIPLALSNTVSMEGSSVILTSINYTDAGLYSCEAINEYTVNGKTSKMLLVIDKIVDVRSEFQWVYPLAVIIITLLLLITIILLCEWRNKKSTSKV